MGTIVNARTVSALEGLGVYTLVKLFGIPLQPLLSIFRKYFLNKPFLMKRLGVQTVVSRSHNVFSSQEYLRSCFPVLEPCGKGNFDYLDVGIQEL